MRLYQSNVALFDHVSLNNEQLKKQTNEELKSKQEDKIYWGFFFCFCFLILHIFVPILPIIILDRWLI